MVGMRRPQRCVEGLSTLSPVQQGREYAMYARLVTSHLKPGKFDLATRRIEEKVIPTLRKQKGFRDEISFYDKDSNESIAISFWDTEADVRKYEKDIYPEMVKSLSETFEEAPEVKHFEVANATFYKIHAS
jgi:heme-degrading monooxygenase HmoA